MSTITKTKNIEEVVNWYKSNKTLYEALSTKVEGIIKSVLDQNGLTYYLITSRAKEVDSFTNKAKKDKYTDPKNEIKDLAGIRVITFVRSEVEACKDAIKPLFKIDESHSVDKGQELGTDKVGYRSVHFVAQFSEDRIKLTDYKPFEDMYFEIQIRTILEHAWADISHDRNYKFNGVLPLENDIQRRFSLAAATLELVDREFDSLANEIESYKNSVERDTNSGNLKIEINTTSLNQYLTGKFKYLIDNGTINPSFNKQEEKIIKELNQFGIHNLSELDELIGEDINEFNYDNNFLGLLRDIMLAYDIEKYLSQVWDREWNLLELDEYSLIKKRVPNLNNILSKYKIIVENFEDGSFPEEDDI
ncbi:hypothetical protein COL77_11085 [Bacillus wiedmannii]|uniref:GTP pyrophosphokinase n=1 Tax=Bacillus wiedmannii TaxID=1890302 RepID=UPI000BF3D454|nr:hypothetical protein [Bacillus wiedmannii]PFZ43657.1 hypothetical protein COL77_11085 [Bacillus wiedmannii]